MSTIQKEVNSIDFVTASIVGALIFIGWLMIYSVGYGNEGYQGDLNEFIGTTMVGKQSIWIGISIIAFLVIQVIDWKFWRIFSYVVYITGIVFLLLVLVAGTPIHGQRAWFAFGGFMFQPAEIAKLGTALALSSYMSSATNRLLTVQSQAIAIGIFVLPIALIALQPDAGSALVFLSFTILLFREGFSPTPYVLVFTMGVLFILTFIFEPYFVSLSLVLICLAIFIYRFRVQRTLWMIGFLTWLAVVVAGVYFDFKWYVWAVSFVFTLAMGYWQYNNIKFRAAYPLLFGLGVSCLFSFSTDYIAYNIVKEHQRMRIMVWLRPSECDPRGELYNVLQSKLAIGGGGLAGKGFLEGPMTKFNYVPEQSTDFIFCTIGEEHGFIGSTVVIILFCLLLYRIIDIAERQRSNFSKYYAYCVGGIIFTHFIINVGMTMGLFPIIGIPLPFVSKGGSSLLGFTTMMAILLKLDSYRHSV
jgi:rod shape determining protein RodA